MNTYLHQKFNQHIIPILSINPIKSALIAISGGQDSLCLIKLIQDLKKRYHILNKIEYVYIDHQWKKDSKYQIHHMINYIKYIKNNISIYQIKQINYSELQCRRLRYQIILQHAAINNNSIIITAHTQTDKIETFLQQLFRGTSLEGATSLTLQRKLNKKLILLRPLINVNRMDICWFCRKFYLPIWSDITNYKYSINRNRLRNELIPYINQYFILNTENNINSFINLSYTDNEYIKQNSIKLYIISRHKKNIALNCQLIKSQHIAIQKRTLQIFFYHNFNKSLTKDIIHKLLFFIKKRCNFHKTIYWSNLFINIEHNWLYIS